MAGILVSTENELALTSHINDYKDGDNDFDLTNNNNHSDDDGNVSLLTFNDFFVGLGALTNARCIVRRPRFVIYVVIYTALGAGDIYYFSVPALSVFMILIPFIVLTAAFYVDVISPKMFGKTWYNKKHFEADCWKMTHLDTKLNDGKTYSNAICWFFDARNDFGIYDDRIFYVFFIIYFAMFIGSCSIHLTLPGSVVYFCFSHEREVEEVELDGRCFFAYEWTLAMNFVTFESIVFCLISSIGVKNECVEQIKNAQQKIRLIIGYTGNSSEVCEYSKLIAKRRENNKWANTTTKKCVKYGAFCTFSLFFAFHLLWFPNDDTKAFYGPNKGVIFFVYILCILILFTSMMMALIVLPSLVGPYKDFYIITTALDQLVTKEDNALTKIANWWLIRQFYHSYVFVIYYQLSNTVFAVIGMCALFAVSVITWWAIRATFLDHDDNEDFLTYPTISVIQFVILMCLYVVIASFNIARVYSHRHKHIKMSKYQIILETYFKSHKNGGTIGNFIELLCTYITNCDVIPTVFGVTITWEKIYLFIGYVISAVVTIFGVLNSQT